MRYFLIILLFKCVGKAGKNLKNTEKKSLEKKFDKFINSSYSKTDKKKKETTEN